MGGRAERTHAEAYEVVPVSSWKGPSVTYSEKVHCDGGATARKDPSGFYHGMRVTFRRKEHVLVGPAVEFVAGEAPTETPQLSLFA